MSYLVSELIRKKRFGQEHSAAEIQHLIREYVAERLPDYQMAAWLMAVCFRGLSDQETGVLTQEMMRSGQVLDFSKLGRRTVDKHSTGGVGDKTSLIIAPLVAACGVPVPMIAGRGLGHTGGTLDKLEAIPGFNVRLSLEQFQTQVEKLGACIIGQTADICPADRKLYALRDVTGTIDSQPLICASIMSKKLAEGIDGLVLDVKYGSGAFMKTQADAKSLAHSLIEIGRHQGKEVRALITRMDEPLGHYVGNGLEVFECLEIMQGRTTCGSGGKDYSDTLHLTLELSAHMVLLGQRAQSLDEARACVKEALDSGRALEVFQQMVEAQGGKLNFNCPTSLCERDVLATEDGHVQAINTEKVGLAAIQLKVGRTKASDPVDPNAGLEVFKRIGDPVKAGEVLFRLHGQKQSDLDAAEAELKSCVRYSKNSMAPVPLIAEVL